MLITNENMQNPIEQAVAGEANLSPISQAINKEVHTEYENFYNSNYSLNVEVPKGMNDNDYKDYTFRLNNSLSPDERVKYYGKNIPYAEGSVIASRKKEEPIDFAKGTKDVIKVGYNQAVDLLTAPSETITDVSTALTNSVIEAYDKKFGEGNFSAKEATLKSIEERNAIREGFKTDTSDAGWVSEGLGSVGTSTALSALSYGTRGNAFLLAMFGASNFRDNFKTALENGASLKEAFLRGEAGGIAEVVTERMGLNIASKYTGTLLRKYAARFGTESVQELVQEAKDQLVLGEYDPRTAEEKLSALGQSALFGGIGGLVGFGLHDLSTRDTRAKVKTLAKEAGLSEKEAEQVQLSTLEENGKAYREEIQEKAKERILQERSKLYEEFIGKGDAPEIAAEKAQMLVPDYEIMTRDIEDIVKNGMTNEEREKLLNDFNEAVEKGGEDADKYLEVKDRIMEAAKEKGLDEDEYLPVAKVASMVAVRNWKVENELNGMTWEDFIGNKGVAQIQLKDVIGESSMKTEDGRVLKAPEGANSPENVAWINEQVDKHLREKYGVITEEQAKRAAIMEENGASEEEIKQTVKDMGEGKLFSKVAEAEELSNKINDIDNARLEFERKNINPELKGREKENVKAVKINRFFSDRKWGKDVTDDEVIAKLDETAEKNENGVRVLKNDNGETVSLSKGSLGEMLNVHSSADNIGGVVNKEAIANLPAIFKTAFKIKETNDIRHGTQNKIIRYANVFESDGEPIMVKITVKQLKGNSKQLTDIEFENNNNRDLSAYSLKTAKKNTSADTLRESPVDKSYGNNASDNIIINDLIDYVNTYTEKNIEINGKKRPTINSAGGRIAKTEEGLRAFYEWFGDSKVVDEQGRPKVMYHGTNAEFDTFKQMKGKVYNFLSEIDVERQGFFFTDNKDVAQNIGKNVLPVYLKSSNVFDLDNNYHSDFMKNFYKQLSDSEAEYLEYGSSEAWEFFDGETGKKFSKYLQDNGYDGATFEETPYEDAETIKTNVVFNPTQIKSTQNIGSFDKNNPKILYSKTPYRNQGAYTPVSRIIEIAKEHTPDTFLHEVSHNFFMNYFDAIDRIADKNSKYVKEAQAVYKLVGKNNAAEFNDNDWEFITQSLVKYLHTGEAPSLATKDVFDRAKKWVISIYNDVARENPVSPELKEFFDSLITEEQDLSGINELHDRISDVIRVLEGAKKGKEAAISGQDKNDIDLLLRALNARMPRRGKTLQQEIKQDGGIKIDSELAKALGYDSKKKNPIFKKDGRFESIDEIADYLRDKGIYNMMDAETSEQVAKQEDDIIEIIQNADMTYSQAERYYEDMREAVAQNQGEAQKVLGEIMDREGLKNLNEVENLLLKARKQMNTVGKDIIAVNKNAIKYIQDSMFRAKKDLGRIMKEQNNTRYNYQQKLKDIIRNLPISYKNKEKLMGNIARVNNKETFDKVASQVMERAEEFAKQEEKNLHRENIKTLLSGTYQRGKNKKFTYEGNKLFEELRNINKMTQEQAANELFKRIEETGKSDGGLSQSEILTRRMLEYKAQGADMSLDNVAQLDFDINSVIVDDLKTREEFDEAKSARTQENIKYLIDKIDSLPASKKALLLLSIKNGDFYSMMNEIGGKEFADKFNMRIPFAEQELYLQKKLASAISKGAEIYGVTPNKFLDVVQELSDPKYTITPNDGYGSDKISKMEIMHIWLGMRQPDTKDLILRNYEKFDENGIQLTNQIDNIISNLELKDIQFAGMLQREMDKDYDEENKAYIFRNGVDMPHHENYFPRTSRRAGVKEDSVDAYANIALQVPSFYKARGKNAIPVFKNVWTIFKEHKADASYAINVFPKYLEIYKMLKNNDVQHHIETKYGKSVLADINAMITSMGAANYTGIYSSMNQTVSKLAGNWIKAKIGINPAIFAKQLISVTNYAENMPVTEYIKNMSYAARHPKEAYDFMQDVAGDFINTRFKLGRQNEVLSRQMATDEDTKKGLIKSSVSQNIDDVITFAVRTGDIAPIIFGGYSRVKYLMEKEGKSKEEARQIFIDETWRSQQASAASTTSNFQKQGGLNKFITAFKNTPMQYARILAEAQTMHNRGEITDKQYYKTLANYMIVQPFLLTVISNGFYNLLHDDDKDKDLISLSEMMNGAATSWLGGVPIVAEVFNTYWMVAQGEKPYDLNIGIFADINKAASKLLKKEKDVWDYTEAVTPLIESFTGKPLGVVERYAKKIFE